MRQYYWQGQRVEVDEEATRAWYTRAGDWDCRCGHCRNFLAVADQLPPELLKLLGEWHIPPRKATYVSEFYDEGGKLLYEFGYRVAGRILERHKLEEPTPWGFLGCDEARYAPFEAPDFPEPAFDLCFLLWLPWVLDEPIDGSGEVNL